MKILITNDDGMNAPQLIPLIRWCQSKGDVTVVVPKQEQSAKSHSIEIRQAFEIQQVDLVPGVPVWSVDSTPADCVRFAHSYLHGDYDLVISGINRGYNLGQDIFYSGTVAAASEAVNKGYKALAISASLKYYDRAVGMLDQIISYLEENRLLDLHPLYNINIPADPSHCRITKQGGYSFEEKFEPLGNNMFRPGGKPIHSDGSDLSLDTDAVLHHYISVTPLTIQRTDLAVFEQLTRESAVR